ncbi:hypothetical protein HF1_13490 [Mycoplasma haemofelis str. Langford 1]|uniref:Uncharacterized protein n=1 Tax=Mycoplasma haemofelis (strain Langford 1) TaxID=941640 RepID=E8ZJN6_MYCHL|nr:hypothetical protein [Mycoplasma haemofelis]CBY93357.1 hypothetical protein HF1_13490 [Mycoplasma haemofelis str. Langford 1]
MASSTTVKLASGLGAAGAVGGGAALSKPYLFPNTPTLKTEIEKDGWTLLTSSHSAAISEVLEAYKKEQQSPFNFKGDDSKASDKLLQECKKLYERTTDHSDKENSLKKLKRWCVVPKTTKERLDYLGVTLFSMDDPSNSGNESQDWVNKAKGHTSNAANRFTDLTTLETGSDKDNGNANKLRKHCSSKLTVKSTDEAFDDTLIKIKDWCSNHSS